MKILVFSDSHGRTSEMYEAVEREEPDAIIHLGDCVTDARDLARRCTGLTIWSVRGNNDYEADALWHCVITPQSVPIYITHGHQERVSWSGIGNLVSCAKKEGCRVALYGHTHCVFYEQIDGVLVLNPGSISLPRGGSAAYARLELSHGTLQKITLLDACGAHYHMNK